MNSLTLANSKYLTGVWNTIPDLETINMLARRLDFVYIDLEHGFRDVHLITDAILLLNALGKKYSVRVRSHNDPIIQTLADFGVQDIILPQVRTKDEFLDFKKRLIPPPLGKRGVHPRLGSSLNHSKVSDITITVIIETRESLDLLNFFVSDPQVESIYLGVFDLAQELEISDGPFSSQFDELFGQVADVCRLNNKYFAAMLPTEVTILDFHTKGVNKILVGIDLTLLQTAVTTLAELQLDS